MFQYTIRILTPIQAMLPADSITHDVNRQAQHTRAILPSSPIISGPYVKLTLFTTHVSRVIKIDDARSLHWLPEFLVANETEQGEHVAYERMIQTCVFDPPSVMRIAHCSTLISTTAIDQLYLEWLNRQSLSSWICYHGRTCGHAYHVPVGSEKEYALMERVAREQSTRHDGGSSALQTFSEYPLANINIGGCTVCWKLSCLSSPLRSMIDRDWRYLQNARSLHLLHPVMRLHRLQRLYWWLYKSEHWNLWKSVVKTTVLHTSM